MYTDHINLLKRKIRGPFKQFGELAVGLSDFCQLKCIFCTPPPTKRIISKKVVETAMTGEPVNVVVVGFGEPTCIDPRNLSELMPLFAGRESKLITNGVAFPELFKDTDFPFKHVRVSLDAGSKDTYRLLKGADVFDDVLTNIERYLNSPAGQVGISFVITSDNVEDIPEFIAMSFRRFFVRYPKKLYLHFKLLYLCGYEQYAPPGERVDAALAELEEMKRRDCWLAFFMDKRTNYGIVRYAYGGIDQRPSVTRRCYASQMTNVLTTDGTIYPCNAFAHRHILPLGTVTEEDLDVIFDRQYQFFLETSPSDLEYCAYCSHLELNQLLERLIDSPYEVAPSPAGQIAVRDAIIYHFTNERIDYYPL